MVFSSTQVTLLIIEFSLAYLPHRTLNLLRESLFKLQYCHPVSDVLEVVSLAMAHSICLVVILEDEFQHQVGILSGVWRLLNWLEFRVHEGGHVIHSLIK